MKVSRYFGLVTAGESIRDIGLVTLPSFTVDAYVEGGVNGIADRLLSDGLLRQPAESARAPLHT